MESLPIITYAAVVVFLLAVVVRFVKIARLPMHLRWELYPVAHEKDRARYGGSYLEQTDWWTKKRESSKIGELKVMVPEILLLAGVREHNPRHWIYTFPFHFGLYLLALLIVLLLVGGIASAAGVEVSAMGGTLGALLHHVTWVICYAGLGLALIGSLALLGRRLFNQDYREYTALADYFNLLFFIGALGVSWADRLIADPFCVGLRSFFTRLVTFDLFTASGGFTQEPPLLVLEVVLASLLVAYIPLTHMSHFFTKWFMYHDIRWGDEPNLGGPVEGKIGALLNQPVGWSAPHIGSDGKKTWAEVATSDIEEKNEMKRRTKVEDISKSSETLTELRKEDFKPLPAPFDNPENTPDFAPLSDKSKEKYVSSLDGTIAVSFPKPETEAEEQALVEKFLIGMEKLFDEKNNWTFLQPLLLSMDHCAKCHTCSDACHIYEGSGENPIYRPNYRSEVFRRLYKNFIKAKGGLLASWKNGKMELNWTTVSRLLELSYRCNLCRRCAQTCPIGVDNALIAREIRKVFSQEMGIAPKELHEDGAVLQLKVGSSTGMTPMIVKDNIEFIDEDTAEMTGMKIETPWDKAGADILLIHNAGEIMAWPKNPGAFATIFESAGVSWTMSSEIAGYDSINYGVWYDDAMFARVAIKHAEAAKKLGVKKIVLGECGHAHKALTVIADRVLTGDLNIPRESALVTMEELLFSGRIKVDPSRNDFPVTLHDPCNVVRLMGIVEPQRRILRKIAPRFREMTPHGVDNYCCGGGSGFAIISGHNFGDWKAQISGRKKLEQILNAFKDELDPSINKYLCAPCSNCKGQLRDMFNYYDIWEKHHILYDGLVELIVNCMTDVQPGFIEWEMH